MKKLLCPMLALFLVTFFRPSEAQAQIPARARAAITIIGYGTAGGALIGAATMAFGTSTRSIAQGASLGLYAGIIFATYVLVSHNQRRSGSYDDDGSPYSESTDIYNEEYESENGGEEDEEGGGRKNRQGFFNRFEVMGGHEQFATKEKGGNLPPLHVNIFQYNF